MSTVPSPPLRRPGRPLCANCLTVFNREVEMRGPVPHPTGHSSGFFYECGSCNHTIKERRTRSRETPV